MKLVKISDAKANLSRHLKYVRSGGRIRILDREHPVADLVPVEPVGGREEAEGDERLLAELERRGLATRGTGAPLPSELLKAGPVPRGRASVAQAVIEERRRSR
jgi:antitoxin (DNA-binding transcriptional repressor) of toxin-antitoxin stability system